MGRHHRDLIWLGSAARTDQRTDRRCTDVPGYPPPVPSESLVQEAAALEADADEYPDQRGEILLEASAAWRRAGDDDRAEQILLSLVEAGGEDGAYARVELADRAFDRGDASAARSWLTGLAADPALHDGHCQLAAELLAAHDDLPGALRWYDRFVARLAEDQLTALDGPGGWMAFAAIPMRARRQLREQLGFPPDAADERVPAHPGDNPGGWEAERARLTAEQLPAGRPPRAQVLVFRRDERELAIRTWPDTYQNDADYYRDVEARRRSDAESGLAETVIVPMSVADLITFAQTEGGSPVEQSTRERYSTTVPQAQHIRWPPARNDRCWCGSGIKYKKCCGRPSP